MKLTIANTGIRQDAEGRFSLNDLHAASGGNPTHQPSNFLRLEQTQALVEEISNSSDSHIKNPVESKSGRYGGSYGAKELVYAYAMWISPKFHLQVIRTFDALVTGTSETAKAISNPTNTTRAHLMVVSAMEKMGVRKEMAMAVALKAIHADTGMTTEGYRLALPGVEDVCNLNQKQLGEILGVSSREIGKQLRDHGLMEDDESGQRFVTERGRKFGEMKPFTNNGHSGYEPRWRKEVLDFLTEGVTT